MELAVYDAGGPWGNCDVTCYDGIYGNETWGGGGGTGWGGGGLSAAGMAWAEAAYSYTLYLQARKQGCETNCIDATGADQKDVATCLANPGCRVLWETADRGGRRIEIKKMDGLHGAAWTRWLVPNAPVHSGYWYIVYNPSNFLKSQIDPNSSLFGLDVNAAHVFAHELGHVLYLNTVLAAGGNPNGFEAVRRSLPFSLWMGENLARGFPDPSTAAGWRWYHD